MLVSNVCKNRQVLSEFSLACFWCFVTLEMHNWSTRWLLPVIDTSCCSAVPSYKKIVVQLLPHAAVRPCKLRFHEWWWMLDACGQLWGLHGGQEKWWRLGTVLSTIANEVSRKCVQTFVLFTRVKIKVRESWRINYGHIWYINGRRLYFHFW